MLEENIIQESASPWSAPVAIVLKKMDATGIRKFRMPRRIGHRVLQTLTEESDNRDLQIQTSQEELDEILTMLEIDKKTPKSGPSKQPKPIASTSPKPGPSKPAEIRKTNYSDKTAETNRKHKSKTRAIKTSRNKENKLFGLTS
ncbi:hypothetical protein QE152_g28352 [Popillia japonica]|uniref:Uncharacterized protein n=1 Tax=Popillia japonica TaxID=7064 RepID=A0AAW1JJ62_POPJA